MLGLVAEIAPWKRDATIIGAWIADVVLAVIAWRIAPRRRKPRHRR